MNYDIIVRWWDPNAVTFRSSAMLPEESTRNFPDHGIPLNARAENSSDNPTFFGHYWLEGEPDVLSGTAACLDYSIGKGGKLVAYRYGGEPVLNKDNFVWVNAVL